MDKLDTALNHDDVRALAHLLLEVTADSRRMALDFADRINGVVALQSGALEGRVKAALAEVEAG